MMKGCTVTWNGRVYRTLAWQCCGSTTACAAAHPCPGLTCTLLHTPPGHTSGTPPTLHHPHPHCPALQEAVHLLAKVRKGLGAGCPAVLACLGPRRLPRRLAKQGKLRECHDKLLFSRRRLTELKAVMWAEVATEATAAQLLLGMTRSTSQALLPDCPPQPGGCALLPGRCGARRTGCLGSAPSVASSDGSTTDRRTERVALVQPEPQPPAAEAVVAAAGLDVLLEIEPEVSVALLDAGEWRGRASAGTCGCLAWTLHVGWFSSCDSTS
jgi:hypothetical protein